MSVTNGKEYQLAIKIAGKIDQSFNTTLNTVSATLKGKVHSLNNTFTKMDKVGNVAFNSLVTGSTLAVGAIGAIEVAAIKAGSEFEKQMSAVKAIAQASDEDLAQLKDKAEDLARNTVYTATEVGGAMEYMGLAGWKTEQMLDGIEGVLNLAAASGEDLATISDIVTDDLTAFNMTAEETQRMVDVMAQTAMNSNTTVTMMGEAFKYAGSVAGTMGYKIEDLGVAVGTIASQGIKSSMAGTALRNMITRLVKPTKESSEAIEALGISLRNDNGEMNSFMDIMLQLREGMKKYDVDKQAYYAAELGGQRGMAAIAAIANASEEDFEKLTRQIYHSEGAAEQMSKIRLDNLAGDVQLLKDNVNDLGLTLYEQQDGPLRTTVQMATDVIKDFKKEVPNISKVFAKNIVPTANKLVDAGKWAVKNSDTIISIFEGFAAATIAYKAASTGVHLADFIMQLGGTGAVVAGTVAALGATVTVLEMIDKAEQRAINNNLASHFGDISLSLDEIKNVADTLTHSKEFEQIQEAFERFDIADSFADSMSEAIKEVNKLNWKVNVGLELSEEDINSYKTAIQTYVDNANKYAEEERYAVSLNLAIGLEGYEGADSMIQKVDAFYEANQGEMTRLGTELSDAVNTAFEDNILDDVEIKNIAELQAQMADIQAQMAKGRLDAQMSLIGTEYGWSALDSESFQEMQEALAESTAEVQDAYRESYLDNYAALVTANPEGGQEFEDAIKALQENYFKQVGDLQLSSANAQIQGITEAYEKEGLSEAITAVQDSIASDMEEIANGSWTTAGYMQQLTNIYTNAQDASGLNDETKGALGKLYENLQPTLQQLLDLKAEYEEIGEELPDAYQDCIDNIYAIGAVSGDESAIYSVLGSQLADDQQKAELVAAAQAAGVAIPEEIINGMTTPENMDALKDATDDVKRHIKENLEDGTIQAEIMIDARLITGFYGSTEGNLTDRGYPSSIDSNADGGIITGKELSWLAEDGPEAVIPINGSKSARSLWERVGQLMGMPSAFENIEIGGGGAQINFAPTLQFNGGAPSQDEINRAMSMSMDEFEARMDEYFKRKSRFSFA